MEMIYAIVLTLHNLIRWVVLILSIAAAALAWKGWLRKEEWQEKNRKLGAWVGMAIDAQLLLGLLLYFVVSPLMTQTILPNFGSAMQNSSLRFFAVEHGFMMAAALVFAHLGSVFAKRAQDSAGKFKAAAIWFSLATVVILAGIPWFRPLLRIGL